MVHAPAPVWRGAAAAGRSSPSPERGAQFYGRTASAMSVEDARPLLNGKASPGRDTAPAKDVAFNGTKAILACSALALIYLAAYLSALQVRVPAAICCCRCCCCQLYVAKAAPAPQRCLRCAARRRRAPNRRSACPPAPLICGLQGGTHSRDLAFINAHLTAIGRGIVVAVLAFTGFLWAARLLGSAAWPARGALTALHLLLLGYDHGNDFQYHGLYNW